jgi:putative Holliday junction resolvase
MGKLLGFDVGAKRTGLATTDALQLIASPLRTVETRGLAEAVKAEIATGPVDGFVVGVPLLMVGGRTDSHDAIDAVVAALNKAFPHIPIHLVDEGNTSVEASAIQRMGGMKKSKRQAKGSLDAISASLILQRHLDATAHGGLG